MIRAQAPAKINLYLRIVRRRDDGYHDIETVFQRLELADSLVLRSAHEGIEIRCDHPALRKLAQSDNLIARAWNALRDMYGHHVHGAQVELEKRIPLGGGLGGGSSDAASALRAFRELFHLHVSDGDLARIAATIGADVPSFLGAACSVGRGIGEVLTPIAHPARCHAVLAFPDYGVPTPEVYRQYAPDAPAPAPPVDNLIDALEAGNDCVRILEAAYNEMEDLAFAIRPMLGRLRERLEHRADRIVRMTGSGSTLFTLVDSEEEARRVAADWSASQQLRVCVTRLADSR